MAGLDLPVKLRRGLGNGKVVPAEELTKRLAGFDRDKDGSLSQAELSRFLLKNRVGGPWFCQVLAKTLWRVAEETWGEEVDTITVAALARIISYTMAAPPRPEKRYVLEPEVMQGLKPRQTLEEYRAEQAGEPPPPKPKAEAAPAPKSAKPRGSAGRPRTRPRANPRPKRRPGPKPRR